MDNKQELLGGVLVDRDNEKTRGMERQSTRVGLDPTLLFLAPKGSWRRFQLVSKGVGDGEESGSSSTAARVLITAVQEIRGWEKKRCQNMSPWVSRRVGLGAPASASCSATNTTRAERDGSTSARLWPQLQPIRAWQSYGAY